MCKKHIRNALSALLGSLLLTSCAHSIQNPYDSVSRNSLKQISSSELCSVETDSRYKINNNVTQEITHRGFKDCSSSELYCLSTLSLKPGTESFAQCRLARDQYELNAQSQAMAAYIGMRQLQLQREAIYTPRTINVNHSGYINHYLNY
jgi:hypothetical protein